MDEATGHDGGGHQALYRALDGVGARPGVTCEQMLVDTNGLGGVMVVEIDAEDPRATLGTLTLLPSIEVSVSPVMEMIDDLQLVAEAIDYRASIPR